METNNLEEIKTKSTKNVLSLTLRNVGIQIVSTLGFFILTLILGAGEVGLFAIVAESVAILGYFSDIGLASALIQKKSEVTKEELQTSFTIQQLLVTLGLIVAGSIYYQVSSFKNYSSAELAIFLALCFSFFTSSLKTIPSVLLERKLDFQKISFVDVAENLLFYLIAVIFALLGFGVFSYAIATVLKSIIGLTFIYHLQSWPLGLYFSLSTAKGLLKFGLPFQLNSFIALAKDRLSNLLVAGILGRESFGLLSWAQKGPRIPLSFMDAIMKITFPTFSRIQDNPSLLSKSISKSTYFIALIIFPALAGVSAISSDFINSIPKYSKWSPAIVPLYLYSFSFALAAITTPLTNAFNAVGKIKITTKLMVMWTVLTWVFYPFLSIKYGYLGTAVASVIVGSSSLIVWIIAGRLFSVNIFSEIIKPTIGSLLILLTSFFISLLSLTPIISLIIKVFSALIAYLLFNFMFAKSELIWFWQQLLCLKSKK